MQYAWLVPMILSFLVRVIAKFGQSLDLAKFKADSLERGHKILPDWIEPAYDLLVVEAVDLFQSVLANPEDIDVIVQAVAAGDYGKVWAVVKDLLSKSQHPAAAKFAAGVPNDESVSVA